MEVRFESFKEVSEFLRDNKLYMFTLIVKHIKGAVENNVDCVTIMEFNVKDISMKIEVPRVDYILSLTLALHFFEDMELYENCVEINNIIKDIQKD
jgi:hypothetical protein